MPAGAEGFDTNGRPDDLLKRITYNSNNFGKGAFLFADADAGPEDESRARRNRFPKKENLELERKLYDTMEREAEEVVKIRVAQAEQAAVEFKWDVYADPNAAAPTVDATPNIPGRPNGDGCGRRCAPRCRPPSRMIRRRCSRMSSARSARPRRCGARSKPRGGTRVRLESCSRASRRVEAATADDASEDGARRRTR